MVPVPSDDLFDSVDIQVDDLEETDDDEACDQRDFGEEAKRGEILE